MPAASGSVTAGVVTAAVFVAFLVAVFVLSTRSRRRAVTLGPLRLDLLLGFACLPGEWPELAVETLPVAAAAGHTSGLAVTVEATDGWLRIDKRRGLGNGRHPFTAQVPLAAVRDVTAGKSMLTLSGASVVFALDDGTEIRGDIRGSVAEAEARLEPLRRSVDEARRRPRPGRSELVVKSPPPRTSPGRAGGLMMASMVPFGAAMVGAPDGPFAAIATMGAFFVALALQTKRPPSMARLLARANGIAAVAFVVDATRTGQPLRLVGAFACLALVARMTSLQPSRRDIPGVA